MCDTMVALGNTTADGRVCFAKNSDRQPNEPHILIQVPRKQYAPGTRVKCTYIEVEQVGETFSVLLLKPSWIWGCEMGCNEFGLNIGNEAVFTREKYSDSGLTGMDMIRLALERCRDSRSALDLMIELLERYGQGGNCGYQKTFLYHNSFLLADPKEAWVLETAGRYWAAEKVRDVRSISNGLSIGNSYERCHQELVEHARQKGWCKDPDKFDFARCYKDPLYTHFSGSDSRAGICRQELEKRRGSIDEALMMDILRTHHASVEGQQYQKSSLKSVCMHGGGLIGDHTTGSYVASLGETGCSYWVTGASTPCLAVFKPFWFMDNNPVAYSEDRQNEAVGYWQKRELFHRMVINRQIQRLDEYLQSRDKLEAEWQQTVKHMEANRAGDDEKRAFMQKAWQQEDQLIDTVIRENSTNPIQMKGSPYFRSYWQRQEQDRRKD
ncbi:MAG: peptidase dipeptidase [Firmicutes bacterium]|nr:peptidase dipeptidase [Bacillota bacterium]